MPVTARKGETAGQRAFREIRARILSGALPAGAVVLESEMALALALSRTPVREAMVRLADEELVELRPRHGMRVRPLSPEDMREIYEVLTELEAAAARRCAEQGLRPEALAGLEAAVEAMDRALAGGDLDAWAEADAEFHRRLAEAPGNARLAGIVASFADRAHRWRMATLRLRPPPAASNDDHRAVVAAIRARDAVRAEAIHRNHRLRAGEMLVGLMARLGIAAGG